VCGLLIDLTVMMCSILCFCKEKRVEVNAGIHSHKQMANCRYEAIAAGDYPEWTLFIQTMDTKDEDKCVPLCVAFASNHSCHVPKFVLDTPMLRVMQVVLWT